MIADNDVQTNPQTKLEIIQAYIKNTRRKRTYIEFATEINRECSMSGLLTPQTLHNWENSNWFPSEDKIKLIILLADPQSNSRRFAKHIYRILRGVETDGNEDGNEN
jgi:hypothetical protein